MSLANITNVVNVLVRGVVSEKRRSPQCPRRYPAYSPAQHLFGHWLIHEPGGPSGEIDRFFSATPSPQSRG
jgi:hypothetical protein